jgi:hypothetical protein
MGIKDYPHPLPIKIGTGSGELFEEYTHPLPIKIGTGSRELFEEYKIISKS